jgi:hypothetical protein
MYFNKFLGFRVLSRVSDFADTLQVLFESGGRYSEKDLPPPTIKELVAVTPKAGRPKMLNELECNTNFAACRSGMEGRIG